METARSTTLRLRSSGYARAAGDEAALAEFLRAGHFEVIDREHEAWMTVVRELPPARSRRLRPW